MPHSRIKLDSILGPKKIWVKKFLGLKDLEKRKVWVKKRVQTNILIKKYRKAEYVQRRVGFVNVQDVCNYTYISTYIAINIPKTIVQNMDCK